MLAWQVPLHCAEKRWIQENASRASLALIPSVGGFSSYILRNRCQTRSLNALEPRCRDLSGLLKPASSSIARIVSQTSWAQHPLSATPRELFSQAVAGRRRCNKDRDHHHELLPRRAVELPRSPCDRHELCFPEGLRSRPPVLPTKPAMECMRKCRTVRTVKAVQLSSVFERTQQWLAVLLCAPHESRYSLAGRHHPPSRPSRVP